MPLELYRIDDRLIHGQVVVGWGRPLDIRYIVLVDDEVASSEWEQELYRMGVPPEMEVFFYSVEEAVQAFVQYASDRRPGILLTGDIGTMRRLVDGVRARMSGERISAVNVGGLHHRVGRAQRMRYVFLTEGEERELRDLAASGVAVTAQDVPAARPVPLDEVLSGRVGA